ncbi:uncharacterized protein LOC105681863 [Bombus impatiens]|uniref:Uncharacterized protein LOC105681863 n=1 Tax=Bombus impatiens TaxID=132113 RepID=A0A6P3V5H9_BOMIM|nr:uncharacterized protein LOC105681863 [Bombus impatiens]
MRPAGLHFFIGISFLLLVARSSATLTKLTTLDDVMPDKWRVVSSGQPPQIELRLFKSHTPEDKTWSSSMEYTISRSTDEPENQDADEKATSAKPKTQLGSRHIIRGARFRCPTGQRRDHLGKCRDVFVIPVKNDV